jgi:hypothetical protein
MLRAKIVKNNTTEEAVADGLNINRTTWYRKLKDGGSKFTVEEVDKLAYILNLSADDIMKIFFTALVA